MLSLILGLSGVRIFSLLCPCLFLPTVPPKGAESEEEASESLQKNTNKKGKAKKSKKVQKTPQGRGIPSGWEKSSSSPQGGSGGLQHPQ